jgi:thiamine biosynthesis lipoprotein
MRPPFSVSRRHFLAAGAGAATLAATGAWVGTRRAPPPGVEVLRGNTMASTYTVKLHAPGLDAGGVAEAHAAVERELAAVVSRMSSFEAGSELSRFNRHASERPVAISAELAQVLVAARSVSEASEGRFDVTIAPVVDAWGFGPRGVRARPAAHDLARARAAVSWRALELDAARGTLAKGHPMLAIDLSGIAQGHGADRVAQALERLGFTDYLVDICGEMRARGLNARHTPWRIGIERPDAPERTAHRIVALERGALATSGDYRIYFEQEGERYSHEIDPRTGAPARHALASVSVVAADAAIADAWATALFVAGPQAGHELALARGVAAYFIERRDGGLAERATPAFAALPSERA